MLGSEFCGPQPITQPNEPKPHPKPHVRKSITKPCQSQPKPSQAPMGAHACYRTGRSNLAGRAAIEANQQLAITCTRWLRSKVLVQVLMLGGTLMKTGFVVCKVTFFPFSVLLLPNRFCEVPSKSIQ